MKAIPLAIFILMAVPSTSHAFTCDQVRWAVKTFSAETIAKYAAKATRAQIRWAKRCLRGME